MNSQFQAYNERITSNHIGEHAYIQKKMTTTQSFSYERQTVTPPRRSFTSDCSLAAASAALGRLPSTAFQTAHWDAARLGADPVVFGTLFCFLSAWLLPGKSSTGNIPRGEGLFPSPHPWRLPLASPNNRAATPWELAWPDVCQDILSLLGYLLTHEVSCTPYYASLKYRLSVALL